jgi:hypothetical protein
LVGTARRSRFRIFPVAVFSSIAGRRAQCFVARARHRSPSVVATGSLPPRQRAVSLGYLSGSVFVHAQSSVWAVTGPPPSARLATILGSRLRSPIQFRAEQPSLPFTSPRAAITLQMQQVKASVASSAGSRASRLATSLSSCGGWRTRVAPNPSVKGTSRKRAACHRPPYRSHGVIGN